MLKIQIMDMLLPWLLKTGGKPLPILSDDPDHRFDRRHWL